MHSYFSRIEINIAEMAECPMQLLSHHSKISFCKGLVQHSMLKSGDLD